MALDDLLSRLRMRYAMPLVPPCPVCGRPRQLHAAGHSREVWGCAGDDNGGKVSAEHYARSRAEVLSGDPDVLELCEVLDHYRRHCVALEFSYKQVLTEWTRIGDEA